MACTFSHAELLSGLPCGEIRLCGGYTPQAYSYKKVQCCQDIPTTWEVFIDYCPTRKLCKPTDLDYVPFTLGFPLKQGKAVLGIHRCGIIGTLGTFRHNRSDPK